MRPIRADIHIHSVLSPCGSLDMSPAAIISKAVENGLEMIAISDHNSTLNCNLAVELGREAGLSVLRGAEVTTSEEVHCLTIFPDDVAAAAFQEFLNEKMQHIKNVPEKFGYQLVLDREENIIDEVEYFLPAALTASIDEVEKKVHSLGGLFIPAHIDRPAFSLYSQLGFMPSDLAADAVEVTGRIPEVKCPVIRNSDSHMIDQVGKKFTTYMLDEPTFSELAMAFRNENQRRVISVTP
ncbi:MAG TPA: PHP domain-containing protein [Bacteroidales bacterium]|nr:PHP domain-containing protein [Bacteroidales bacterium]